MKQFVNFKFKPDHQRKDLPEVEFDLKPLDQRTLYIVNSNYDGGMIAIDGAFAAFEACVVGWSGLEQEFSTRAKRAVLSGVGDIHWMVWLGEISAELYKRALIGDDAAKN